MTLAGDLGFVQPSVDERDPPQGRLDVPTPAAFMAPCTISAPNVRYGLPEASVGLNSRFVEACSSSRNGDGTLTVASRLSGPQHTYAELQERGLRRWYELNDGAVSPSRPGM